MFEKSEDNYSYLLIIRICNTINDSIVDRIRKKMMWKDLINLEIMNLN